MFLSPKSGSTLPTHLSGRGGCCGDPAPAVKQGGSKPQNATFTWPSMHFPHAFPSAAVTETHSPRGSKQHRLTDPQFWWSGALSSRCGPGGFPPEALGQSPGPHLHLLLRCPQPLARGPVLAHCDLGCCPPISSLTLTPSPLMRSLATMLGPQG